MSEAEKEASLKMGAETTPEETSKTPEETLSDHDKDMQRKAQEARGEVEPEGETTDKPSWCPENYWDTEKGEVIADALQKALNPEEELEEESNEDTEQTAEEDSDEPNEAAQEIQKIAEEFTENQEITDDQYQRLEKLGIDKTTVDTYVEGQLAIAALSEANNEQMRTQAFTLTGSETEYSSMIDWALENLSEAEVNLYNESLDKPDLFEATVSNMYERFKRADGYEPSRLSGKGSDTASGLIKSRAELVKRFGDPRYATDTAYQRQVAVDMERSRKAGYTFN